MSPDAEEGGTKLNPEMADFMKEINRKEDAEELRLLLVALREENELLKNRESERLRAEAEMSLLYRQMEDEVKGLRKENASLTKENADLREKLERASTGNALKANTIFGRRTEKLTDLMDQAENGTDTEDPLSEEAVETEGHKEANRNGSSAKKHGTRKKGKRKEDLSKLPKQTVYEYDEKELDRLFGEGNWRIVSWHNTVKKEYLPSIVYAKETMTPVVSVGLEHVMECLTPKNVLLPGSDATPSLVAAIMNNKFSLALPVERQARELARHGIALSRQTMTNWVIRFSEERFAQVYSHLAKLLKKSGCTQCDETTILVIRDGRRAGRKSYMWVHITSELGSEQKIAVFTYEPDRSADHLRDFYEDYVGEIICDAYSAYKTFEAENGDVIVLCGCWMHSRRRWAEALRVHNTKGLTKEEIDVLPEAEALRLISEIYKEEMPLKHCTTKERLHRRKTEVKEKVDAYFTYIESLDLADPEYSKKLVDAVQYSLNQKESLCRFLEKGNVPMDNGACERTIRSLAVGRGNWMFSTSPEGARSNAIMYSLVETAKANGADVYYYLKYLLENTPSTPELRIGEKYLDDLMPWSKAYQDYEAAQKKELFELRIPPSEKEPTGKKLMGSRVA